MRVRTWAAIAALFLVGAFFVVNWRIFAEPVKLNLVFTSLEAPVGLVTLALFAVFVLVLIGYVGFWQSTFLMEFRRQARELEAQRTLAANAEASRFTDLAKIVRDEIGASDGRLEAALAALSKEMRESENSIAATIAELDERLARGALPGPR